MAYMNMLNSCTDRGYKIGFKSKQALRSDLAIYWNKNGEKGYNRYIGRKAS